MIKLKGGCLSWDKHSLLFINGGELIMGVIICVSAMLGGSVLGIIMKNKLTEKLKTSMLDVFGFGAITIGVININKADCLSIVILALILGTLIGELLDLEGKICGVMNTKVNQLNLSNSMEYMEMFLSAAIVFCVSGSGIFGAILEGVSGDNSVLISKAILDLFTALIFAATLGKMVMLISIPEVVILFSFFLLGRVIMPYLDESTIQDFMATGGIITMMAGISILNIKKLSVINVVPALIVVFALNML